MNGMTWIRVGAVVGGLGVVAGAFGAHGLEGTLDSKGFELFETAARYQMYHAPALLAVGLLAMTGRRGVALNLAGWSLLIGVLIFSGSLYGLAFTRISMLGMVAPVGGLALIIGWFALAVVGGRPGPDRQEG